MEQKTHHITVFTRNGGLEGEREEGACVRSAEKAIPKTLIRPRTRALPMSLAPSLTLPSCSSLPVSDGHMEPPPLDALLAGVGVAPRRAEAPLASPPRPASVVAHTDQAGEFESHCFPTTNALRHNGVCSGDA